VRRRGSKSQKPIVNRGESTIFEHMFALVGSAETLLGRIARRRREIDAMEAEWITVVAEFERSDAWNGFRSPACALASACHITEGAARAHLELARKLDVLPKTASSFARGDISRQHVNAIAAATTPERADQLAEYESQLVHAAERTNAHKLIGMVKHITD